MIITLKTVLKGLEKKNRGTNSGNSVCAHVCIFFKKNTKRRFILKAHGKHLEKS